MIAIFRTILAPAFVLLVANSSMAGLILSFAPATSASLVVGSGATLDVFVRSSDGTDLLDGFQVEFALIPSGGAPIGGLQFVDPQSDSQLNDGDYVFDGRSLSFNTLASIGTVFAVNTIFRGYDATDDGTGGGLAGNPDPFILRLTDLLLFRLDLFADTAGDYELYVYSADFFSDQLDPNNTPLTLDSIPAPAMLTVTSGVTTVPEPGTGTLGLMALMAAACFGRRRRRTPLDSQKQAVTCPDSRLE